MKARNQPLLHDSIQVNGDDSYTIGLGERVAVHEGLKPQEMAKVHLDVGDDPSKNGDDYAIGVLTVTGGAPQAAGVLAGSPTEKSWAPLMTANVATKYLSF